MKTDKVRDKLILIYGLRALAGDVASSASVNIFKSMGYFRHLLQAQLIHYAGRDKYALMDKGEQRIRGIYNCKKCGAIGSADDMLCPGLCLLCYNASKRIYRGRDKKRSNIAAGAGYNATEKNYVLRSFFQLQSCHSGGWFRDYDIYDWELISRLLPILADHFVEINEEYYRFIPVSGASNGTV